MNVNRKDRRKQGLPAEPTYTLNQSQIAQMKSDAVNKAVKEAFVLMLGLPVMVIHDKYPQLMKREGREETLMNLILEQFDAYQNGYFTMDDVRKVLEEECGLKLKKGV